MAQSKKEITVNEAGRRGGRSRAKKLTKERKREIATMGGQKMKQIKDSAYFKRISRLAVKARAKKLLLLEGK